MPVVDTCNIAHHSLRITLHVSLSLALSYTPHLDLCSVHFSTLLQSFGYFQMLFKPSMLARYLPYVSPHG
jgi:hypothetical protein